MERLSMKELVPRLEQELIRMGYAEGTLKYYRAKWKMITAHFDERGETCFSEAVAMEYVDKKCNFFEKERTGTLTQSNAYLFHIVRMMGDFAQHGTVLRRYARSLSRVNEQMNREMLGTFREHCKSIGYAVSTRSSYARTAENFLCYIEAHGIPLQALNAADLTAIIDYMDGQPAIRRICSYAICLRLRRSPIPITCVRWL